MDPNAPTNDEIVTANEDDIRSWARQNALNLVLGAAVLGLIFWKLHPLDVFLAAAGLTLIIFLHELGHFTAAKLCKVHVETFSIGFGPAIPFCAWKYGETTYKLAIIPLGGFVKMLGEGENAEGEEAENDPRSFKNQSVPERMLIISSGVIMNIILAFLLFVIVYMHGLPEAPAMIAALEPGGALWRQDVHSGSEIVQIGTQKNLWFEDVKPIVWGTDAGEKLEMTLVNDGKTRSISVEPRQEEGGPFPLLGFVAPYSLTLYSHPRDPSPPFYRGSAAAKATSLHDGPGFLAGDEIVTMTDPDAAATMSPLRAPEGSYRCFDFEHRLARFAGEPVMVGVRRKDAPADADLTIIALPGEFRRETGLRMRMGPIVAVREGTPAAGLQAKDGGGEGDRIVEVEVKNADGSTTLYAADAAELKAKRKDEPKLALVPLDPLRLPWLLHKWSQTAPSEAKVKLTVLRSVDHSEKRVPLELAWDRASAADLGGAGGPGSSPATPIAINGLGLAYQVQACIDEVLPGSSAAAAGLQAGDTIEAVKFHAIDLDGEDKAGRWEDVKPGQWAFVDRNLQTFDPHAVEVRINRGGQKIEAKITGTADAACPVIDRGLSLMPEYRIQKASDIGDAMVMGVHRTIRMIKTMYINLYAMAFGRVSAVQTMSGPITLARLSYKIAGESSYKLLLTLALISINLAVVNFLPIPMLDGGHMMFLLYEAIVGRPPPERVHFWLSMLGLAMVLSLMVFVIGLDLWRLAKAYFGW